MTDLSDLISRVRGPLNELRGLGVDFDALVVRSEPFGALIDANTRQEFTPPLGAAAYPICLILKAAYALSLQEISK